MVGEKEWSALCAVASALVAILDREIRVSNATYDYTGADSLSILVHNIGDKMDAVKRERELSA